MAVWWLAIDRKQHTSYEQLKERKVIAQGWSQLGDLQELCRLAKSIANKSLFESRVDALARGIYGNEKIKNPKSLWWLFQVQCGDLLVGIEGTTVRGICQADYAATESYRYDRSGDDKYAQTICSPVEWFDWNEAIMGMPPTAPAQSVPAIRRIQNEQQLVVEAWKRLRV